jgi:hypothetical protein
MSLSVRLTLNADHNFDFARAACIHSETGVQLCSDKVFMHAYAMFRDDGSAYKDKQRRWHHIAAFFDSKRPWYEPIPLSEDAAQLDRAAIYLHYGYLGAPKWDLLAVEVIYHVACPDECPKRVTLDPGNLMRVDNDAVAHDELNFHSVRVRDYRPVIDPGP